MLELKKYYSNNWSTKLQKAHVEFLLCYGFTKFMSVQSYVNHAKFYKQHLKLKKKTYKNSNIQITHTQTDFEN